MNDGMNIFNVNEWRNEYNQFQMNEGINIVNVNE